MIPPRRRRLTVPRAPLIQPLSCREERIVELVAAGLRVREIARQLARRESTVIRHVTNAAAKIPGDLPPRARIMAWWRGASLFVLAGERASQFLGGEVSSHRLP